MAREDFGGPLQRQPANTQQQSSAGAPAHQVQHVAIDPRMLDSVRTMDFSDALAKAQTSIDGLEKERRVSVEQMNTPLGPTTGSWPVHAAPPAPARDVHDDGAAHLECPHGVDDGACKQCYDEATREPNYLRDTGRTLEGVLGRDEQCDVANPAVMNTFKIFARGQGYDLTTYEQGYRANPDAPFRIATFWDNATEHAWRGWAHRAGHPSKSGATEWALKLTVEKQSKELNAVRATLGLAEDCGILSVLEALNACSSEARSGATLEEALASPMFRLSPEAGGEESVKSLFRACCDVTFKDRKLMSDAAVLAFLRTFLARAEFGIRDGAIRECAEVVETLRRSHATEAGEELGDPSCDFQAAWETARERINALLQTLPGTVGTPGSPFAYAPLPEYVQMIDGDKPRSTMTVCREKGGAYQIPLFAFALPANHIKGLSDDEIVSLIEEHIGRTGDDAGLRAAARAIKAAAVANGQAEGEDERAGELGQSVSPAGQENCGARITPGAEDAVAWLWYEPASEWNGYTGRRCVGLQRPKVGPSCQYLQALVLKTEVRVEGKSRPDGARQ